MDWINLISTIIIVASIIILIVIVLAIAGYSIYIIYNDIKSKKSEVFMIAYDVNSLNILQDSLNHPIEFNDIINYFNTKLDHKVKLANSKDIQNYFKNGGNICKYGLYTPKHKKYDTLGLALVSNIDASQCDPNIIYNNSCKNYGTGITCLDNDNTLNTFQDIKNCQLYDGSTDDNIANAATQNIGGYFVYGKKPTRDEASKLPFEILPFYSNNGLADCQSGNEYKWSRWSD